MKQVRWNRMLKRGLAYLLCLCLLASALPVQAMPQGNVAQGSLPERLSTADGEVSVDENWNETYPFGAFAFGNYQADIGEPGAADKDGNPLPGTALLPVYRIGGTTGRVTARITYAPAITTDESGAIPVYDYAASGRSDIRIEYEDANPLAAYQTIGLPEKERQMLPAPGVGVASRLEEDKNLTLSLTNAGEATGFRWQYKAPAGGWKDIEGADKATLTLKWEDYSALGITGWDGLDFRCVLTVEDYLLCTVSLGGEDFKPYSAPQTAPEDLEIPDGPTYTTLEFDDEFDIYEFELTFAQGETVKYIRVSALDDDVPELPELGLFTIVGCEGGQLSELCNTLTLMVSDNDEPESSELGFTLSEITADRADGVVYATVKRTGGKSYNVTVDYTTVDGTAKAGVDYAAKSGTLAFAGSIDEIKIPIELISNSETGEKSFSLRLSGVKGGGTGLLCALKQDTLGITLSGASPQFEEGRNLATVLSGADGQNAAGLLKDSGEALIPDGQTQHSASLMQSDEPIKASIAESAPAKRSHVLNKGFKFERGANYSNSYWHDWEIIAGNGSGLDASDSVDYSNLFTLNIEEYGETGITIDSNSATGFDKEGRISKLTLTNKSGIDGKFGKYLEISSNYKGSAEFMMLYAGKLFDQVQLAAYLESVGVKTLSLRTDRFISPEITLAAKNHTSQLQTANFSVSNTKNHYYYWMTNGNGTSWSSTYPSGKGTDSWNGESSVSAVPLDWKETLMMDAYFLMRPQWKQDDEGGDWNEIMEKGGATVIDIPVFRARRRVFEKSNSIPIVIYTANDSDERGGGIKLTDSSEIYKNMIPKLELVPYASGVNKEGKLYAGSKFSIDTAPLTKNSFIIPDNGLFVTNQNGERVGTVERSGNSWTVTMDWNNMTLSSLNDSFQINIVLSRSQKIEVNVGPSTSRDENGNMSDAAINAAFDNFSKKTMTVGCSSLNYRGGYPVKTDGCYFSPDKSIPLNDKFSRQGKSAVYAAGDFTDIQTVNFGQDKEDIILYRGRAYNGDETITVSEGDLTNSSFVFTFYDSEYLDAITPLEVSIDHVDVYFDGNGNDVIDGSFNSRLGIFSTDSQSGDEWVATVSGDYPESSFAAVRYDDGSVRQYFFKVFYSLHPKALNVPAGASKNDRAQVMPMFLSAVTDSASYSALSPEQQSYRYITGGNTDDCTMYGAEATTMNYVDIPLGGDTSTITMESETVAVRDKNGKIVDAETKTTYTWEPDFVGNLLIKFDNPTPAINEDNITGHSVPMAGENPAYNSETGKYAYSKSGIDRMNAFLGAFSGRSTFALGVQQQKKAYNSISDPKQINPESIAMGGVATTPNADGVMNLASGGEPGQSGGSTPDEGTDFPEFGADLGTELPSLELELGDYATLIMDGYQVGFAIGIPLYKYEDTNYSGSEKTENCPDGTKTSSKDKDGNLHETITTKDGKTVTEVTTKVDPNDPNKRVKEIHEVKTDDKGNKTYRNEIKTQEKQGDNWVGVGTTIKDNNPPAPSQEEGGFKKGFSEANGQMQTLADFVSACKARNLQKMKDFMSGAFEDDSLKNAKNGNCTSTKVEVSFTVQLSIMFEYNPIDNCHFFKQAGLSASLGIELSVQHRFSMCPLVYVYVKLGIEVEVSVSLSVIRNAKEGKEINSFVSGSIAGLAKKQPVVFELDMRKGKDEIRGFHLDMVGTVYMEVFDKENLTGEALDAGALSGDGSTKEVLLKAYNKKVYVRLTPVSENVFAEKLRPVVGAESKVVFDGLNITPSIELEAGIGVGIELLKFELYVKTSIAITITMGGYLEETDTYEGFYISSFEWGLSVGFNITALFFNYSMDCIGISVEGEQHGTRGYFSWDITASAANGEKELWNKQTYTDADGKSLSGEPQPPNGINISPDEKGFTFYNADGSLTDTSEDFRGSRDWSFMTNVHAWRWEGGDFMGEIPQNADLSKATKTGAMIRFRENAGKIKLYFDGTLKYKAGSDEEKTVKKSPVAISIANDNELITLTLNKDTTVDRYEHVIEKRALRTPTLRSGSGSGNGGGLIHVSAPTDISDTQRVTRAGAIALRSVQPTGTADFELSGYGTSGDAKKLVSGLATGYSYRLFAVGDENYIIYPMMLDGAAQLVMSRIVMTGDLSSAKGLEHPTDPESAVPYLKVDSDSFGDLDYSVEVSGNTVTAVWTGYTGAGPFASATEAAKNVTVKRARLKLGTDSAFSPAAILDQEVGSYRYLPAHKNGITVWAQSSGDGRDKNDMLAGYLLATNKGLTQQMLDSRNTDDAKLASAVYRWLTQSDLNAIYGADTKLVASNGAEATIPGESIENIETETVDGRLWALYSTTQAVYFDASKDVPVTAGPDDVNGSTEHATIRRLYLRILDGAQWGDAVLLQTVIDFDGCSDDNLESAALKDGIYTDGALVTAQADPYYANMQFIEADIDGSGKAQQLLLFEMGGNTYLITAADAQAVTEGESGTVTPIFEKTTGNNVSIGTDGENLAVVYTAAVPGSLSNAIYMAWWDKNLKGWGSPVILAMRNLRIYEDVKKYDMDPKEAEKAYLGQVSTPAGNTGSMDRLTFADLQMSAQTAVREDGTENSRLLVLTTGSFLGLKENTFNMGEGKTMQSVIPDGDPNLSFYAVAFGAGEQGIGLGSMSLANYDFTVGSRLIGEVSFTNTGTTALRASEENPLKARLLVSTKEDSQELVTWTLTQPIRSGESVTLSYRTLELAKTLPAGASFAIEVSEDSSYFEEPFVSRIENLLTVEERPELSLFDFDLSLASVSDGRANLNLKAAIANNGSAAANSTYIQFTYDTGLKDEATGEPVYAPIDITGSRLDTTEQAVITKRGLSQEEQEFRNGIYRPKDKTNSGENNENTRLDMGFSRSITGTLSVPTYCFVTEGDLSGLHIRAEVYSDYDTPQYNEGLYSSEHKEYNTTNNRAEQILKHQTFFNVPSQISTALGTTLMLPVSFTSTSGKPDIVLTEISDGSENWSPRMGICYYDADRGIIVAAPNSTAQAMLEAEQIPTGVLQLKDMSTNSIAAITYKIGSMAEGVNIYRDDKSFSFFNADGKPTNVFDAAANNPGWMFLDKGVNVGWTGDNGGKIPMNNDLAYANQDNVYFTFETVADAITFYFMGEITVQSSVFGGPTTIKNPSEEYPGKIVFNNETGKRHTVKVTAKKGTRIDRYVAEYKTNPAVDADPAAPKILWSRSFPETASLEIGESVPMTCYIFDGTGLKSVSFDGQTLNENTSPKLIQLNENLYFFDYTFNKNDFYRVRATDSFGNTSSDVVGADWFNDVLSAGAIADAPALTREDLSFVDGSGNAVGQGGSINAAPYLKSAYAPKPDEETKAYMFYEDGLSGAALSKSDGERWMIVSNGCYLVRVDRADGTWARAVAAISGLDLTKPQLSASAGSGRIDITVSDDRAISSLTVNGYAIPVSGKIYSGGFAAAYGGSYTVKVTDDAGNTAEQTVSMSIPPEIKSVSTNVTCANGNVQGIVVIDPADISGGSYDSQKSSPAVNAYAAAYEAALAPAQASSAPEEGWIPVGNNALTLTAKEGKYSLFIRDSAGNTAKYSRTLNLVHPEMWEQAKYEWSKDFRSVTANRVCKNDSTHIESEIANTKARVSKQPTCTEKGETTYTAEFSNPAFTRQIKKVADINATGHNPAGPVRENEVAATVDNEGSYDEVICCSICGEELSRTHVTTERLQEIYSVTADRTQYAVNGDIVLTVKTPDSVEKLGVFNENGDGIFKKSCEFVSEGGTKTWTVVVRLGSKGKRTLSVMVRRAGFSGWEDKGLSTDVKISSRQLSPASDAAEILSVEIPQTVRVKTEFEFKVITTAGAGEIGIINENGVGISKKIISREETDGRTIWTLSMSIGTKGEREMTARLTDKNGGWDDGTAKSFSVKVVR